MKIKVTNLLVVVLLLLAFNAMGIEIGDGEATNLGLPCEPYYGYSISQTIYPQELINVDNQRVVDLAYHYNGANAWTEESVTIWMGHTDLESFETGESWVPIDDLIMVYDGEMSVEAVDGWVYFQLEIPFRYNNSQNLVIGFEQNSQGYHSSSDEFYCTAVESNLSIMKRRDSADYNFVEPPVGTLVSHIPNIIMNMSPIPTEPEILVLPNSYSWEETVFDTVGEEVTFTVYNNGGNTLTINSIALDQDVDFTLNDSNNYPADIEANNIQFTVTFTPQSIDDFTGNVVITDAENNVTNIPLTAVGIDVYNYVIIGDGTIANQHLPIKNSYSYSYSQVIYYPSEIGNEGRQLDKISWYYNGNSGWSGDDIKIYVGQTSMNSFPSSSSWLSINQLTEVFDGELEVPNEEGWIEFELEVPFPYDHTQNLVVAAEENTDGYHGGTSAFLCTAASSARGIIYFSDTVNPDPVTPPDANYMQNAIANIKLEFSDIIAGPDLTINPTNVVFDMTAVGEQSAPMIVNIRSSGQQNAVITDAPTITGANADQFSISLDNNSYPLTMPFDTTTEILLIFTPTNEEYQGAILNIIDNATRTTHQINLEGYGFADDGNDSISNATVLELPVISETYAIMPVADIDWYKLPSLGVLDTLTIFTEMSINNNIDLRAWIYGPADNSTDIDIDNPLATDSNSHGFNQPEMIVEIPESGDYYLMISEDFVTSRRTNLSDSNEKRDNNPTRNSRNQTGTYELTIDVNYNYAYNSPLNLEAENSSGFISLSWTEPPYERYLVSYDIFRDGEQINSEPITETSFHDANVIVGTEYTYTVVAVYEEPAGESAPSTPVTITYITTGNALFGDDFEEHDNFTLEMPNWIQYDEDGANTYSINNVDFDNSGEAISYIVFNPSATTPPVTDMVPQSGEKLLCSFASTEGVNNDWLITPTITIGTTSVLSFYAKSYSGEYALEKFKVLMSQDGEEITDFTLSLHPNSDFLVAPTEWTPFYFNLSELTGMTVRFAVQCISEDSFIFMMDNFRIDSTDDGVPNSNDSLPTLTQLNSNYPNPFNPETTISYSMREAGDVRINIYNIKGQKVKTLINEYKNIGNHKVVWNGEDESNNRCASGIYLYKMESTNYIKTHKMILIK